MFDDLWSDHTDLSTQLGPDLLPWHVANITASPGRRNGDTIRGAHQDKGTGITGKRVYERFVTLVDTKKYCFDTFDLIALDPFVGMVGIAHLFSCRQKSANVEKPSELSFYGHAKVPLSNTLDLTSHDH